MQERRTTIRCETLQRAQYCSFSDLTPRDGRLTDLTERGLGLMAHEPHQSGERLTVSFTLPGEEDPLTTTGVVRWASQSPVHRRWFPLGLEWFPLEETARFRLETFLGKQIQGRAGKEIQESAARSEPSAKSQVIVWGAIALVSAAIAVALLSRVQLLQQESARLTDALSRRDLLIAGLGDTQERASQQLELATTQLSGGLQQLEALQRRNHELVLETHRLAGQLEHYQAAYTTLREERQDLILQVLSLEQDRARLVERLATATAPAPSASRHAPVVRIGNAADSR